MPLKYIWGNEICISHIDCFFPLEMVYPKELFIPAQSSPFHDCIVLLCCLSNSNLTPNHVSCFPYYKCGYNEQPCTCILPSVYSYILR
jgi:hypothetical protein